MKSKLIALAILLGFLIIPCMAEATTYSIFPGQNQTIDCNETGGNHTVKCTVVDVCKINRTLLPNETYSFHEGPCGIDFRCAGVADESLGYADFPMITRIENKDNATTVNLTIWDWVGNVFSEKSWSMDHEDRGYQEFSTAFRCPAEIKTEINLQTCSKFMNQILQTGDPLLYQLATGQTACMDEMIKCQGDLQAEKTRYTQTQVNYQERVDETQHAELELAKCEDNLDPLNRQGTLYKEIQGHVPAFYMWGFFGLLAVLVIIVAASVFKAWW